ncbi:MAG TPA: class E sortase [Actinomycetota bacterium]|nr:class E sortase [Actinomycetota bacterium]
MALRVIGRGFIGLGTLILLFLLYQLVGTNLVTGRQQKALAGELEDKWATSVAEEKPDLGEGMSIIRIPKIGVDQIVVEGVEVEDLKKGPGHYPDTALPGQLGNMVISGHRTTYGAPFYRLDELKPGDDIIVYDAKGPYTYKVSESKIVLPTEIGVIAPSSDARLTLTTCHPRFSAAKRLIIVAQLQGTPTGLQTTDPGVGPLPEA